MIPVIPRAYLLLAAVAALALAGWYVYSKGAEHADTRWRAEIAELRAQHQRNLIETERANGERMAAADAHHQQERARGEAERDRLVADLRAGQQRLRQRFTCPAAPGVSPAAAPASGGDAGAERGLSLEDAEFLVRLAAEADAVARQLQACQATVRVYSGVQ